MQSTERDGPFPMGPEGLYSRPNELLGRAHYSAVQDFAGIHVTATGVDPTPGWRHYFRERLGTDNPPDLAFVSLAPQGIVNEVLTPFLVPFHIGASCTDPVRSINVYDADGKHVVPVTPSFAQEPDAGHMRPASDKDNGFPRARALGNDSIFPLGSSTFLAGRASRYLALGIAGYASPRSIVVAAIGQNSSTGWVNRLTPEFQSGPVAEPAFAFEQIPPSGQALTMMVDFVETLGFIDRASSLDAVLIDDADGRHRIQVHNV